MKKIYTIFSALFLSVLISSGAQAQGMLQIKGSDTLINLVQKLSEDYMQQNSGKYIAVTGGGSGTGIAALINGKCDIADASRGIKTKEVVQANSVGVDPQRVVIAVDGLSVIVNPQNSIDRLTVDELGKIFRGEVTNWSEVGGANLPITLYGRQSNSGTFAFFQEAVLKADYSQKMDRMNGNAQIVEAVKSDKTGIGYVGVGYVKDVTGITVLRVASRKDAGYASPLTASDVNSGKYPIARPLNQYFNGMPKGNIKDFIAFELSPAGQRVVEEEGFFPISQDYKDLNRKVGL